uniref:Uncharacterized protein n=1 Tax=Hucho hucho TaxID=62062 RepID=A0A4W5NP00_9TELE
MAPTITSGMNYSKEHLTLTSIQQLKSLLGPEILNQQSDSKLEKADMLDLPVKTQSQRRLLGHFQSLQPSSDKNRRESDLAQLSSPAQYRISKEKSPVNSTLWRPW